MNYVSFHVGDWDSSTRLLSPLEKGIYIDLLMLYYSVERPLMRSECERIARAYANDERQALSYVLDRFFEVENDIYRHHRCDAEIAKCYSKSEKAAKSAKARWDKRKTKEAEGESRVLGMRNNCETNTDAMQTQCGRNADAMLTKIQYPISNNHIEHADVKPEPKAKKRTRLTLETLPDEWAAYVHKIDDRLDPDAMWDDFANYWTNIADKPLARDWKQVWEVNARKVRDDPKLCARFLRSEFKNKATGRPQQKTFCADDYHYEEF